MEIVSARNPMWSSPECISIMLQVQFKEFDGEVTFFAMPGDVEMHGRELFVDAINGKFGDIAAFVPTPAQIEEMRQQAEMAIDSAAEAAVPPPPGGMVLFALKVDEARRVLASDDPKITEYPLLAVAGDDLRATAEAVMAMHKELANKAVEIEKLRTDAQRIVRTTNAFLEIKGAVAMMRGRR